MQSIETGETQKSKAESTNLKKSKMGLYYQKDSSVQGDHGDGDMGKIVFRFVPLRGLKRERGERELSVQVALF